MAIGGVPTRGYTLVASGLETRSGYFEATTLMWNGFAPDKTTVGENTLKASDGNATVIDWGRELPKPRARLGLLLASAWVLGLLAMGFLLHRVIVIVSAYDELFTREAAEKETSREIQISLKKQVQEWKNVLLRGEDRIDREQYLASFFALEANTGALATRLREEMGPNNRDLMDRFVLLHRSLGRHYREGLVLFERGEYRNLREVDKLLRGEDRVPTDLIDEIVGRLDLRIQAQKAEISRSLRIFGLGLAAAFLLLVALYAFVTRALANARTASEALAESEARFRRVFLDSATGMMLLDADGRICSVNHALCQILGYGASDLKGCLVWAFAAPEHTENMRASVTDLAAGRADSFMVERRYLRADGAPVWLRISLSALRLEGRPLNAIALCEDVSARKQLGEELRHRAFHDSLTGLPNRASFELSVAEAVGEWRPGKRIVALLYIDLDGFKLINDTCGHNAGDRLLQEVAKRMKACLDPGDLLARVGGDEFTVITDGTSRVTEACDTAEKLLAFLSEPFRVGDQEVFVTASIGVSLCPRDGTEAGVLIRCADTAMYEAKLSGKNGYRVFNSAMDDSRRERLGLETDLRHSLERNQIVAWFQPQYDMKAERVVGFEALCRWFHPVRGVVPPSVFIPIAEESGMIVAIGNRVLQMACEFAVACNAVAGQATPVAVNVSAVQFARTDFADIVCRTLAQAGLPPSLLELELTESLLLRNMDENVRKMHELRAMGIRIAIDDFGTGYSSLGYLDRMPIDGLKIDRAFVQSMASSATGTSLIRSIVAMAHGMNLRVVVEGVETAEQLHALASTGCDEVQGFLLGRPEPRTQALQRVLDERGQGGAVESLGALSEPLPPGILFIQ